MPHIRSGLTVHIANPTQDTCVPTQATLQVCRKWPQANGWMTPCRGIWINERVKIPINVLSASGDRAGVRGFHMNPLPADPSIVPYREATFHRKRTTVQGILYSDTPQATKLLLSPGKAGGFFH